MILVHIVDVVRGGQNHLVPFRENDGLEHIDHLCNGGQLDAVRVFVENIEVDCGQNGIAHGVLLKEMGRVGAGLSSVPGSPFVHHQTNRFLGIIVGHDAVMPGNNLVNFCSGFQQLIPLLFVKLVRNRHGRKESAACGIHPARKSVVVEGQAVRHYLAASGVEHKAVGSQTLHEFFSKMVIFMVGSGSDQFGLFCLASVNHFGYAAASRRIDEVSGLTVLIGIILRTHLTAASPYLVPIPNASSL